MEETFTSPNNDASEAPKVSPINKYKIDVSVTGRFDFGGFVSVYATSPEEAVATVNGMSDDGTLSLRMCDSRKGLVRSTYEKIQLATNDDLVPVVELFSIIESDCKLKYEDIRDASCSEEVKDRLLNKSDEDFDEDGEE